MTASHAGQGSGGLLATNTVGAILGSLVVPFVLIPLLGSPVLVAVLALVNACFGDRARVGPRRATRRTLDRGDRLVVVAAIIVVTTLRPGVLVQPNEAYIASAGGRLFDSTEDEIASVQAGQISFTPELWVAGTSMTLLTVDAKLMPVLPLIARPESKEALVVAFGMGSAFRAALIAGLHTEAVELVPSVPEDVRLLLPGRGGRPRRPERQGHRHRRPEPPGARPTSASTSSSRTRRPDRELRRRGHLVARVLRSRPGSPDRRRDHDAVAAVRRSRQPISTTTSEPSTRSSRRSRWSRARAATASTCSGRRVRSPSTRPTSARSSAGPASWPTSRRPTTHRPRPSMRGSTRSHRQTWLTGDEAKQVAGDGPLITDDHPRHRILPAPPALRQRTPMTRSSHLTEAPRTRG